MNHTDCGRLFKADAFAYYIRCAMDEAKRREGSDATYSAKRRTLFSVLTDEQKRLAETWGKSAARGNHD